jgi:drug/metabolite transporter (DMT)-like permease
MLNAYTIILVLAMALWGINWPIAKILQLNMLPHAALFFRFLFSGIALFFILFFKKISFKISKKEGILLATCALLTGAYHWCFFNGVHYGNPGAGGVLTTTLNPIWTFIIVALINKKNLEKKEYLGLSLGAISLVFFLQLWQLNFEGLLKMGNMYFLIASILWAGVTIQSQKTTVSPFFLNFIAFATIAPFFTLLGSPNDIFNIANQNSTFWYGMIYIVIFGTVIGTTAYFYATQKLGAKAAASYLYIVPSSAVLSSYLLLGEVIKNPMPTTF